MKQRPVIFISGAYRAPSAYQIGENIRLAGECALDVWQAGGIAICPHKNTALFDGARGIPDSVWLEGDLELLRRSDAMYLVPGWANSHGAIAEVVFAHRNHIPILAGIDALRCYIEEWRNSV